MTRLVSKRHRNPHVGWHHHLTRGGGEGGGESIIKDLKKHTLLTVTWSQHEDKKNHRLSICIQAYSLSMAFGKERPECWTSRDTRQSVAGVVPGSHGKHHRRSSWATMPTGKEYILACVSSSDYQGVDGDTANTDEFVHCGLAWAHWCLLCVLGSSGTSVAKIHFP